ncbi:MULTISPECIES: DNA-processing protein DprA [Fusobacterium]|jgi:DNA protecting protein dprA|uniref:DNA processing protein DprA n=1 Tax=Fusobacterium nucleatum subsp. polymorphum TaxID=76857 RepID=A0A2C6B157_FUSNP|nr:MULTISPECIES: DNA-processing protein DprA [Fusobacterium]EUB29455.1 DNA protecting protein DprA [Fusobacterium sp. OBRC1]MCG6841700.1 DNA-processing protein DprA [Fusobacterium nucleatum]PHH97584.1 DNA processing protein DprA [Fusobacterium polymorphum]QYR62238.1 DNA-processing protein DprA [Fusobacterium polymorphum]WRL73408.1 DNA-processing protein DprA [Fusobacterium polymorphum]
MKYNYFTIEDDIYPQCLKEISNPPLKLYYKGNLDLLKDERLIAVVGTRNPSSYGKLCCEYMVKKMTSANITIVSGFAKGIDSIAHKTSLLTGGKTIAVIASGLDIVYPASNLSLYREIEEKGLILSEYEAGVKPFKFNFPQRNRIIAGLSKGIIVVESKDRGGSLITADLALEFNRDVYAVPGDVFSEYSKGCNNLIRDSKAKSLSNINELLDDYSWKIEEKNINNKYTQNQLLILNSLSSEKNLDNILMETKIEQTEILAELMTLEIMGVIKSIAGGRYKKIL